MTACPKHQPQIQKSQSLIYFVATMNKNQDLATVAHWHNNPAKHLFWNIFRHNLDNIWQNDICTLSAKRNAHYV